MVLKLRDYQSEACVQVMADWEKYDRVLVSMPTGTGKGRVLSWLADAWREGCQIYGRGERVLWLTHRVELLAKAKDDLEEATGEIVGIEQGELRCDSEMFAPRIVAASIDSLKRAARRESFNPNQFGLVLYDEVHHAPAEGNLEVLNYFSSAKVCGATATTDRSDEISLGIAFSQCSFHMDIREAIQKGWLCKLLMQHIEVDVDFSKLKEETEIDMAKLDRILTEEKPLHQLCAGIVKKAGNRQTVIFVPRIESAKAVADMLADRYTKRGAGWVSSTRSGEERAAVVAAFNRKEIQFIVNVDCLTEGWDSPAVACIVIARPTKSRLKFAQMIGRGLRGGVNCPVEGKTNCLVLEMTGKASNLSLVSSVDVLGGAYDKVVLEEAKRNVNKQNENDEPSDVVDELVKASARGEDLRRLERLRIIGEAKVKSKTIDPFTILDLTRKEMPGWWSEKPPTESQLQALDAAGIKTTGLVYSDAQQLLDNVRERRERGLCTAKQARILTSWGYSANTSFEEASRIITQIMQRPDGAKFTKDDAIRRANRQRQLMNDALLKATRQARIIWGARGSWKGLEIGPDGSRTIIKSKETARTMYRQLKARGVIIEGDKPPEPPK